MIALAIALLLPLGAAAQELPSLADGQERLRLAFTGHTYSLTLRDLQFHLAAQIRRSGPDLVVFPDISGAANFEEAAAILREAGFEATLTFGDTLGEIREYTVDGSVPEIALRTSPCSTNADTHPMMSGSLRVSRQLSSVPTTMSTPGKIQSPAPTRFSVK